MIAAGFMSLFFRHPSAEPNDLLQLDEILRLKQKMTWTGVSP